MPKFKRREAYFIVVKGARVEVSEEVYRIHLLSYNHEKRAKGKLRSSYRQNEAGSYVKVLPEVMLLEEHKEMSDNLAADPIMQPDRATERKFLRQSVQEAFLSIPVRHQVVITELYLNGKSQQQVADLLHVTQASISYTKTRALMELRCRLLEMGYTYEDICQQFPNI